MSIHEFWEEDPNLFWAYRFSYINNIKQQKEYDNANAWLQGAYFYEAISAALSNAFSKNKTPYRDKPFDFNIKERSTEEKIEDLESQLKARANKIQELLGGATKDG